MSQPNAVTDIEINDFVLSVTTRKAESDTPQIMKDLTSKTLSAWLWMAELLQNGTWDTSVPIDSVEEKYAKDNSITLEDTFGEARVTIWVTWRSRNKDFRLTLNSNDKPQDAVAVRSAHNEGIQEAIAKWNEKHPQNASKPAQDAPPRVSTVQQATTTPNAANSASPAQFVEGAIFANSRPDSRKVQYADGQLLIYNINRVVASTFKTKVENKTVPIIELYSPFSTQHPTLKVYIYKNNSQELSPQWLSIKDLVEPLNLGALKPEAVVNWQATAKVSHSEKEGKTVEYYNVQSLKAI